MIGSWGIGTGVNDCLNIDVGVEMPKSCFTKYDMLKGAFLSKRTLYLSELAHVLSDALESSNKDTFPFAHDYTIRIDYQYNRPEMPFITMISRVSFQKKSEELTSGENNLIPVRLFPFVDSEWFSETFTLNTVLPNRCHMQLFFVLSIMNIIYIYIHFIYYYFINIDIDLFLL